MLAKGLALSFGVKNISYLSNIEDTLYLPNLE